MGCLSVTVRRVSGEPSARVERLDGGATCRVDRIGGMSAAAWRIGGRNTARVERLTRMTARVGLVCSTNIDIRPGILWASDGRLITLEGGFLIPNGR